VVLSGENTAVVGAETAGLLGVGDRDLFFTDGVVVGCSDGC